MTDIILEQLNRQLAYARANSPFYANLPPEPLRSPEDFRKIPFTTPRDLAERGREMLCCSPKNIRRMVTLASSGTTAKPKRLAFTESDLEKTVDFFAWGMGLLCRPEEKVAIFMPGVQPDGLCDLLSRGIASFGALPLVYGSISQYRHGADFLRREAPEVLVGTPAQLRRMALTEPNLRPRSVLLSADYCSPALKNTISRLWDCQVYEHYGLTESGLGCAVECPKREGMYCRKDIYLEIDRGELVLTTLCREGMPLIRYRTGDLAQMLPNGNLSKILGRREACRQPVSQTALEDVLFGIDGILDFRARVAGDTLRVSVLGETDTAEQALRKAFPGVSCQVISQPEASFPCTGKRKLEPHNPAF